MFSSARMMAFSSRKGWVLIVQVSGHVLKLQDEGILVLAKVGFDCAFKALYMKVLCAVESPSLIRLSTTDAR